MNPVPAVATGMGDIYVEFDGGYSEFGGFQDQNPAFVQPGRQPTTPRGQNPAPGPMGGPAGRGFQTNNPGRMYSFLPFFLLAWQRFPNQLKLTC